MDTSTTSTTSTTSSNRIGGSHGGKNRVLRIGSADAPPAPSCGSVTIARSGAGPTAAAITR